MTRDPAEGVDGDGVIVTGASVDRVLAVYRPVVEDCTAVLTEMFGGWLHSLYLYGSVATGQARPPESDVDLIPVWVGSVAPEEVADVAAALSRRHRGPVREVGLAPATLDKVRSGGRSTGAELASRGTGGVVAPDLARAGRAARPVRPSAGTAARGRGG